MNFHGNFSSGSYLNKNGSTFGFLINSRETRLIDMKIKMAELVSGYQKAVAELYYSVETIAGR